MRGTRLILDLNSRMRAKNATNEALAARAGISTATIAKARLGGEIRFAECVEEALEKYNYQYLKPGRKRGIAS